MPAYSGPVKRFLRRWLGIERPEKAVDTPSAPPVNLRRQVSELEERIDYLEEALNRLRGKVTGADRKKPEPAPDAVETTNGAQLPLDRWQLGAHAKGAKRGVLPG